MNERELLRRIAQLFVELGAEVRDDLLHTEVFFRTEVGLYPYRHAEKYGVRFTKRLFSVGLGVREDGRLYYALSHDEPRPFIRATVLPLPLVGEAEADLEKGIFQTGFWDRLWGMVRMKGFREALFPLHPEPCQDLGFALRLYRQAEEEHERRPRRETLLLKRELWGFILREAERIKMRRKKANLPKREAYEELLRFTDQAPHSLNVLRKICPGARVQRIAPGYWRVDAGEFSGWGGTPVGAAADLLRMHGRKLRRDPALAGRT